MELSPFDRLYWNKYINIVANEPKSIVWIGSSRRDLKTFPKQVRSDIGQALYTAQMGDTDPAAKPLKGFGGASVMEIIDRYDRNTYRAVYTVQFSNVIYVLHAFQKKSKKGIATPQSEIELVQQRLKRAAELHQKREH